MPLISAHQSVPVRGAAASPGGGAASAGASVAGTAGSLRLTLYSLPKNGDSGRVADLAFGARGGPAARARQPCELFRGVAVRPQRGSRATAAQGPEPAHRIVPAPRSVRGKGDELRAAAEIFPR